MLRSTRLAVVLDLAKRAEKEAARVFTDSKNRLQHEQDKLGELEQYYNDYIGMYGAQTSGVWAIEISRSRQFLQQLSDVKKEQASHISKAEGIKDAAKQVWQKAHLKYENMDALVRRYKIEENKIADKTEQKMIDEWVSQRRS